jgi:hypothetical protein
MIDRPNDPSIENGYALRREILPKADAELDCRIQKSVQVAHSASRKVMEHHDGRANGLAREHVENETRGFGSDPESLALRDRNWAASRGEGCLLRQSGSTCVMRAMPRQAAMPGPNRRLVAPG